MDDDFDEFADEFFNEATLALADRVEQNHISLTQQPPKPTQSNRHALAMPSRSARTVGLAKGAVVGYSNETSARARTGQPAAQSTSNLAPRPVGGIHPQLSAPFKTPTIVPKRSPLDESEYYPDVTVTETGFYQVIESSNATGRVGVTRGSEAGGASGQSTAKSVADGNIRTNQRPGAPASRAVGASISGGHADSTALGDRKPISRSISMGPSQSASHPQSHFHPPANARNPRIQPLLASRHNAIAGPSGSQAGGYRPPASQGPAGSQGPPSSFKRTNSIGESARRLAINKAMGMLPDLKEESIADEGHQIGRSRSLGPGDAVEVDGGNSLGGAAQAVVQDRGASDAAELAQALKLEMEKMKQRMEQLEKDKADAEKKAKEAQANVWKYQGEAKIIRGKFEEKEKAHETLAESMKKKVDIMQETLAKQKAEHQREIDGMNTVNAFKTHNLLTSTTKAGRFPSTQRSALRNGSSTPSRQYSAFPQGTPSRSPGKQAFNRSPSKLGMVRSPVRMGGSGAMLPPPAPIFHDGFKTPSRPQPGSKKASKTTAREETESAPAIVGFSNIAQSFNITSVPRMTKKQKVRHDESVLIPQDASPRSSSPLPDDLDAGVEMIWEQLDDAAQHRDAAGRDIESALTPESVLDQVGSAEADAWQKVVHLVLTHSWVSQSVIDPLAISEDLSENCPPTLTLHKAMHYEPVYDGPKSEDHLRPHLTLCRSILGLCGETGGHVSSLIADMTASLWNISILFARARHIDTVLSLLNLLSAIFGVLTEHAFEDDLVGSRAEVLEHLGTFSFSPFLESLGVSLGDAKPSTKGKDKALVTHSPAEAELILSFFGLLSDACLDNVWLPESLVKFASSPCGVVGVLHSTAIVDLQHACVDLIGAVSANTHPRTFRWLLSNPETDGHDPTRVALVAGLCDLMTGPTLHGQSNILLLTKALGILSNLAQMDRDAAFLLGQNYHLVPAVIRTLERASDGLWGISADPAQIDDHMLALIPCLTLLHYLVFPPSTDDPEAPSGLDLAGRLQASAGIKDLVGLHHIFVTALGRISYAETDILDGWAEADLRSMQDLAQDLLDVVVVGPEGDAIYEIYVSDRPAAEPMEETLDDMMPDEEEFLAHLPPDDDQDMS